MKKLRPDQLEKLVIKREKLRDELRSLREERRREGAYSSPHVAYLHNQEWKVVQHINRITAMIDRMEKE